MIVVPFEEWHFDHIELDGPEQKMLEYYGNHSEITKQNVQLLIETCSIV